VLSMLRRWNQPTALLLRTDESAVVEGQSTCSDLERHIDKLCTLMCIADRGPWAPYTAAPDCILAHAIRPANGEGQGTVAGVPHPRC